MSEPQQAESDVSFSAILRDANKRQFINNPLFVRDRAESLPRKAQSTNLPVLEHTSQHITSESKSDDEGSHPSLIIQTANENIGKAANPNSDNFESPPIIPMSDVTDLPNSLSTKSRSPLQRSGTIYRSPDNRRSTLKFLSILEKAARTDERLKSLNRFFNRKKLVNALLSKKQPLDQNQLMIIGDQSNAGNNLLSNHRFYDKDRMGRRKSDIKNFKRAASAGVVKSTSKYARAKLISMLKLAKTGQLQTNRCFQWCHFFGVWLKLVCNSILAPVHPEHKFKLCWDIVTLLFIVWQMIITPLNVSFPESEATWVEIIQTVINCYFIADILLSFQTGYYSKGGVIMDRKLIARKYLKRWFLIDLISTFPYEWVLPDSESADYDENRFVNVLRVLRVLKVLRVVRVSSILSRAEIFELTGVLNYIISLLKLSGLILIIAHWIACSWHLMGVMQTDTHPETWLTRAGIQDESWEIQYIFSIYWAVTTMITVGYGDITPVTSNEKMMATCVMIVASGVFAFTMNSINNLLQQMNQGKSYYQDIMLSLSSYMRHKHMSKELKGKIRNYITYTLKYHDARRKGETLVMSLLSDQLKNEMIIEVNGRVLKASKTLNEIFSQRLIISLTLLMNQMICSKDEIIFREDTEDDCSIYFLDKGSVELFNYYTGTYYTTLTTKELIFGEISFVTGKRRTASARSGDFSALFSIKRDDFYSIIDEHPRDRQRFCMIKDQIMLLGNYSALKVECFSCKSTKHVVAKCPDLHYGVQRQRVIQKYIDDSKRFRKKFERAPKSRRRFALARVQREAKSFVKKNQALIIYGVQDVHSVAKDDLNEQSARDSKSALSRATSLLGKNHVYLEDFAEQFSIKNRRRASRAPEELEQQIKELNALSQLGQTEPTRTAGSENNPTFDRVKDFEIYFPHNNFSRILKLERETRMAMNRRNSMVVVRRRERDSSRKSSTRKATFFGRIRQKINSFIGANNSEQQHQQQQQPKNAEEVKPDTSGVETTLNSPLIRPKLFKKRSTAGENKQERAESHSFIKLEVPHEETSTEIQKTYENQLQPRKKVHLMGPEMNNPSIIYFKSSNLGSNEIDEENKQSPDGNFGFRRLDDRPAQEQRIGERKHFEKAPWTFADMKKEEMKSDTLEIMESQKSLDGVLLNDNLSPENAVDLLVSAFGADKIAQVIQSRTQLQDLVKKLAG